jgi:hypothetical protein
MPDVAQEIDVDATVTSFVPLADWWANKIQWCEDDHCDLVQEGLLALVQTLRGYNKSGREIRDLAAIASVCFRGAMQWYYKKSDRTFNFVGFEDVKEKFDDSDAQLGKLFVERFLVDLESAHGVLARRVVEHLLEPGEEIAAIATASMKAKQVARANGERVIGYGAPRFHRHYVQAVVGLDASEWERTMTSIKQFTRGYMQLRA